LRCSPISRPKSSSRFRQNATVTRFDASRANDKREPGYARPLSHTTTCALDSNHTHAEEVVEHGDADEHDHAHGLVDRSILRSRAGIHAVSWSLGILTVTALAQVYIYSRTLSVALLADLIHNFGDALTAIPLGIAFYLRSARGERWAGVAVVLAIFISALVALGQTIERFLHPRSLSHLWLLAAAGVLGFIGNEIAAQVRLRAGRRLNSSATRGRMATTRASMALSAWVFSQAQRSSRSACGSPTRSSACSLPRSSSTSRGRAGTPFGLTASRR
jgi:hypothetical protein